ncbi:RING finger protein 151-like isoform X2 [Actinia tenebrosa]|uniref:RING finger protein 151-like isoform X2 n=1 Tax=Actinia tenebrosa TaxID=6105 RepID=A0A6P8HHD7_ACTTE|nr:RING finger protein 151-like isoform X2 [Actinia tenebrosa]
MGFNSDQFVNSCDENLHCPICHGVFQDPVSCKDGHTFCSEFIELWLKTSKNCPLDNTLITDSLVRNLTVYNIVNNLYVYCFAQDEENKENGEPKAKRKKLETHEGVTKDVCNWNGKLQELKKHQEVCAFYQVRCPHANCIAMVQRRHVDDHTQTCIHRTVTCKDCQAQVIQHDLQLH